MSTTERALIASLIRDMKAAYAQGRNAMQVARERHYACTNAFNNTTSTLIAYDLQAGSYVEGARRDPAFRSAWTKQISGLICPHFVSGGTLLEVGCGEATTLTGVIQHLHEMRPRAMGFDISWSRVSVGREWTQENGLAAELFVGDLFAIPLASASVDVVYTAHSLEPNGGREREAIAELLRVARHSVVLVEPLYEHAPAAAQERMRVHGYVRGLAATCRSLGAHVISEALLPLTPNPLNPSGAIVINKMGAHALSDGQLPDYRCPITGAPLQDHGDVLFSNEVGLAYPVLRGIPLLRPEHVIVASHLKF